MDVADPRYAFWDDSVLAEIAGLDEVEAFRILAKRIATAKQSMAAGRGPSVAQYTRVGRRLVEIGNPLFSRFDRLPERKRA